MAFYKDFGKGNRQERKQVAQSRGGFDDEGSHYSGARGDSRGNRPHGNDRTGNAGARPYGDKPGSAPRSFGDRPSGERRPYGDKPGGERRPYGDRPGSAPRSFGDRPSGERRPYGDKPSGERRPYGDRPGSAPRSFGDRRPNARGGDFRFAPNGQRPYEARGEGVKPRSYNDQRQARRDIAPREASPRAEYDQFRYDMPERAPVSTPVEPEEAANLLTGRNPIREALKSGRDIEKLMVARGDLSGSAREILSMAKERRVPVQEVERTRLDAIAPNHQGMIAYASAYQYSTVEDMLELAKAREEQPFLVILDGVTDPHNLGAIIRSAECAGAHGVIVQERRAVGLTPAAVKASAGAVEYIPVARVVNLTSVIEQLKAQNIWIYAADMGGEDYREVDFKGGVALVIGAEGEGVSRLVLDACDKRVSLPIRGKLDSLNASVAAGVLLYEVLRAR